MPSQRPLLISLQKKQPIQTNRSFCKILENFSVGTQPEKWLPVGKGAVGKVDEEKEGQVYGDGRKEI